jgi:predicted ATPase/DNA-binding XRE family transcriptional regulator
MYNLYMLSRSYLLLAMTEHRSSFGSLLRRQRKALDLTQVELAARAGCALATIKKIETGARQLSRRLAKCLAHALALSADQREMFLDAIGSAAPADLSPPLAQPATSEAPSPTLVTLTGPGGVGKTRLALQVAAELRDAFADGVWLVDLAPLNDGLLVPGAIARALGLKAGAEPLGALVRALRDRRMLLLLDNFEQVAGAAPLIAQLLVAAPHLTILATSHAPLHLSAEQEYVVPPLELPPERHAQVLDTYAAVQLFVRRVQAIQPHFVLSAEDAAVVAAICRRLDGLPLAIELAAQRPRLFAPPALLRRRDRRLALLTGGPRNLPARPRSLRATLGWSYHLLGLRAQRVFARLGVFIGGATLDAIEAVCGRSERSDVLADVTVLLEQSLVRQFADAAGDPRIVMLETIREYALEQLAAKGQEMLTHSRHAAFYLALAEAAVPRLRGPEQVRWLDQLEADHDTLRAACAWFLASDRFEEGLRMVGALHWFWDRRGYLDEGRARIQAALDAANGAAPTGALLLARAWALAGAATLAFDQGDRAGVAALAEQSAALFRQLGDSRGLTLALLRPAFARSASDPEQARGLLDSAIEHARATGAPWFVGLALFVSAQAALSGAGDTATARASITEALPALQLAVRDLFAESLRRQHAAGNTAGIAEGLAGLAALALEQGRLERAARLSGAAEAIRGSSPAPIWPAERFEIDRYTEALRSRLAAPVRAQWCVSKAYKDGISSAASGCDPLTPLPLLPTMEWRR